MTLPTLRGASSGIEATATTSHSTNLPVTANAGDYVVVFFAIHEGATVTVTDIDGLTEVDRQQIDGTGNVGRVYLLAGRLTASQTAITFTTSSAATSVMLIYHFDPHANLLDGNGAPVGGSDDSPDPQTPSNSQLEEVYEFAACGWLGDFSLSSYPTGFSDNQLTDRVSTGSDKIGAAAAKKTVASTQDPGPFTLSAAADWMAMSWQVEYLFYAVPGIVVDAGAFSLTGNATSLARGYKLLADAGAVVVTGNAAELARNLVIVGDTGAFVYTSIDAGITRNAAATYSTGEFVWSGIAAGLDRHYSLTADGRSLAWTGIDAGITRGSAPLAADAGTFSCNGNDAGLVRHATLAAGTASLATAGIAAGLCFCPRLTVDVGSFVFSGTDVAAVRFARFDATGASFALGLVDAGLVAASRLITADAGAFTELGQSANLIRDYRLSVGLAAFDMAGYDATQIRSRTLLAAVGSFSFDGVAVTASRVMLANSTAFALDGIAVSLNGIKTLTADATSYAVNGLSIDMRIAYTLTPDAGDFSVAGFGTNFTFTRVMVAAPGEFLFTGQDAALAADLFLGADNGPYTFTGQSITLAKSTATAFNHGSYISAGSDAGLIVSRKTTLDAMSLSIVGFEAMFCFQCQFTPEAATFALIGGDAGLVRGLTPLIPMRGEFLLTEASSMYYSFVVARNLAVDGASFVVTGQDARFAGVLTLLGESASYAVTASDVAFTYSGKAIAAEAASFTLTGNVAIIFRSMTADAASYAVDLSTTTFSTVPPPDPRCHVCDCSFVGGFSYIDTGFYFYPSDSVCLLQFYVGNARAGCESILWTDAEVTIELRRNGVLITDPLIPLSIHVVTGGGDYWEKWKPTAGDVYTAHVVLDCGSGYFFTRDYEITIPTPANTSCDCCDERKIDYITIEGLTGDLTILNGTWVLSEVGAFGCAWLYVQDNPAGGQITGPLAPPLPPNPCGTDPTGGLGFPTGGPGMLFQVPASPIPGVDMAVCYFYAGGGYISAYIGTDTITIDISFGYALSRWRVVDAATPPFNGCSSGGNPCNGYGAAWNFEVDCRNGGVATERSTAFWGIPSYRSATAQTPIVTVYLSER